MISLNLDMLLPDSAVELRLKGSSIFFSCGVLSLVEDKLTISLPSVFNVVIPVVNQKVELKIPDDDPQGIQFLYTGIVMESDSASLCIRILTRHLYDEKRHHTRIRCELRLRYMEALSDNAVWLSTYTTDISPGGLKMYSTKHHPEGQLLLFQFTVPDGLTFKHILVKGRVTKVKRLTTMNRTPQTFRRFVIGVAFEDISEKDRKELTRYIFASFSRRR